MSDSRTALSPSLHPICQKLVDEFSLWVDFRFEARFADEIMMQIQSVFNFPETKGRFLLLMDIGRKLLHAHTHTQWKDRVDPEKNSAQIEGLRIIIQYCPQVCDFKQLAPSDMLSFDKLKQDWLKKVDHATRGVIPILDRADAPADEVVTNETERMASVIANHILVFENFLQGLYELCFKIVKLKDSTSPVSHLLISQTLSHIKALIAEVQASKQDASPNSFYDFFRKSWTACKATRDVMISKIAKPSAEDPWMQSLKELDGCLNIRDDKISAAAFPFPGYVPLKDLQRYHISRIKLAEHKIWTKLNQEKKLSEDAKDPTRLRYEELKTKIEQTEKHLKLLDTSIAVLTRFQPAPLFIQERPLGVPEDKFSENTASLPTEIHEFVTFFSAAAENHCKAGFSPELRPKLFNYISSLPLPLPSKSTLWHVLSSALIMLKSADVGLSIFPSSPHTITVDDAKLNALCKPAVGPGPAPAMPRPGS